MAQTVLGQERRQWLRKCWFNSSTTWTVRRGNTRSRQVDLISHVMRNPGWSILRRGAPRHGAASDPRTRPVGRGPCDEGRSTCFASIGESGGQPSATASRRRCAPAFNPTPGDAWPPSHPLTAVPAGYSRGGGMPNYRHVTSPPSPPWLKGRGCVDVRLDHRLLRGFVAVLVISCVRVALSNDDAQRRADAVQGPQADLGHRLGRRRATWSSSCISTGLVCCEGPIHQ